MPRSVRSDAGAQVAPANVPSQKTPSSKPRLSTRPVIPPPSPPAEAASPLPALPPSPRFEIGEKAVHPSHGVGEVTALERRNLGGTDGLFYTLRILDNGIKVMVPVEAATAVGLRRIMSPREADAVLETMRAREVAVDLQPWSRRFRAYTEMIQSGSPLEIAKVLRDMHRLRFDKDLSFGERRLLDQAKSLLFKELALAKKMPEDVLAQEVAQMFVA